MGNSVYIKNCHSKHEQLNQTCGAQVKHRLLQWQKEVYLESKWISTKLQVSISCRNADSNSFILTGVLLLPNAAAVDPLITVTTWGCIIVWLTLWASDAPPTSLVLTVVYLYLVTYVQSSKSSSIRSSSPGSLRILFPPDCQTGSFWEFVDVC